ncbi:MAG: addB [Caulobacteraceae bacterium]|nr:addB [Caulobacteraceae bacterium]
MLTGWFSIAPERPFLDDLARGLLSQWPDPMQLAEAVVLVPTRRAGRDLAAAFVGAGGGMALLLPQIRALGDLDEGEPPFEPGDIALDLPPAITPWRRRFELAGVAHAAADRFGRGLDAAGALEMAQALGDFLDTLQIEGVDPRGRLEALAAGDHAEHWRASTQVLDLALETWPGRLAQLGLIDVTERRVRLLDLLAERWRRTPPERPLVAAGSTGAQPATARLLTAIAGAPQGLVVLPGLDLDMPDSVWDEVEDQHPQASLRRLLAQAGVARSQVSAFPPAMEMRGRWRRRLVSEALRPAETTDDWLDVIGDLRKEGEGVDPIVEGLAGLRLIEAAQEEEAASACALLLREALETPGQTAALITPDIALARRVSAYLTRWGVSADSTAGRALNAYPAGVLALCLMALLTDPSDPVALLAVLKHPLNRLGEERARADLERYGLRGPRPRDRADLTKALAKARIDEPRRRMAESLADDLFAAIGLTQVAFATGEASVGEAARGLAQSMEALGGQQPWSGSGGECLSALLSALIGESKAMPACTPRGFAALVEGLISRESVRGGGASHPRLRIMGVLEGRLIQADRLILAGLEEGVWPRAAPVDPFLSRPMREQLGLPSPERRVGLSAHDFAQAACAPHVTLVTAARRGGAPAVPSRWIWRLSTLARGANQTLPGRADILSWSRALGEAGPIQPAPRPRPSPPIEARPTELPVTAIERWLRDPYETYARYVLKLRPLDPPDLAIGPRERGTAIHAAMERFGRDHGGALPAEAQRLIELGLTEALVEHGMPQARMVRESALMARLAPWIVAFETGRREDGPRLLIEQKGRLELKVGGRAFTLTAKADRLEVRGPVVDILDFKTGRPPSQKEVESHIASQLTLTAAIVAAGGFEGVARARPGELLYVQLTGRRVVGEALSRASSQLSGELAAEALQRLRRRVAAFFEPGAGYLSKAMPHREAEAGDYDHLARVREWSALGGDDDGGGE